MIAVKIAYSLQIPLTCSSSRYIKIPLLVILKYSLENVIISVVITGRITHCI